MSKTVKGARIRLKRSETPGVVPTIPTNDDHTTGWLDTDIYIGELFINTSVITPGIWFRETSGITRIATLDSNDRLPIEQLTSNISIVTNNFDSNTTIDNIIDTGTQYVVFSGSSELGFSGISNIDISNLEVFDPSVNIVHISLDMYSIIGSILTVNIIDSNNNVLSTSTISGDTMLKVVSLLWDNTSWKSMGSTGGGGGTDPTLSTALSSEIINRGSADTSLSTAISLAGGGSTTSLSSAVSVSYSNVTSLSSQISVETVGRQNGDLSLSGAVSVRTSVDVSLSSSLSVRVSVDSSLSSSISVRTSVDSSLSSAVSSGDLSLSGQISVRTSVDSSLSSSISVRTSVDVSLSTAIAGGNVSKVPTPKDDQVAVWTNSTTIEGTSGLTYSTTTGILTVESGLTFSSGEDRNIQISSANSTYSLNILGQYSTSGGNGGNVSIIGGRGAAVPSGIGKNGGDVVIFGGSGGTNSSGSGGVGGNIHIIAGVTGVGTSTGNSGNVYIYGGTSSTVGDVYIGNNSITSYGQTIFGNGSSASPSLTFLGDTSSGFYYVTDGTIGITTGLTFRTGEDKTISISNNTSNNDARTLNIYGQNNTYASVARVGGPIQIIAGHGSLYNSTNTGGEGGSVTIQGGVGGSNNSSPNYAGDGGSITIQGGQGGVNADVGARDGNGGDINVLGGYSINVGSTGVGGNIYISGGVGDTAMGGLYLGYSYGTTLSSKIHAYLANVAQTEKVVYNTGTGALTYEVDSSDIKFKKDLIKISDAIYKINQISGYTYTFNDDASRIGYFDTTTRNSGVIAQDVESVFPEVVRTMNIPNSLTNETYKMVEYDKMIPLLIEGIKELKIIIDAQQAEIDILKNK